MHTVSACIATYKRPEGLRRLLNSLSDVSHPPNVSLEIVIVDNHPRTAEAAVAEFAKTTQIPVVYEVQPEANISITRNVSVSVATGEFIWFIDDDETAHRDCLMHLWTTMENFGADVVFGQICPAFEKETPEWIQRSTTFNRPPVVTGRVSEAGRTGNTLVRGSILNEFHGPFDPALGRSGGEDSKLFGTIRSHGYHLVDCAEAVAGETIPPSRATWAWMVRRSRRLGYLYARNAAEAGRLSLVMLHAKAAARVVPLRLAAVVTRNNVAQSHEYELQMWSCIGRLDFLWEKLSGRDRRPIHTLE